MNAKWNLFSTVILKTIIIQQDISWLKKWCSRWFPQLRHWHSRVLGSCITPSSVRCETRNSNVVEWVSKLARWSLWETSWADVIYVSLYDSQGSRTHSIHCWYVIVSLENLYFILFNSPNSSFRSYYSTSALVTNSTIWFNDCQNLIANYWFSITSIIKWDD